MSNQLEKKCFSKHPLFYFVLPGGVYLYHINHLITAGEDC